MPKLWNETIEMHRLEVKARDGKNVVLVLDQKTKYLQGKKAATPRDVVPGSRVVVTTMEESGVTRALEVRLPERKEPSPSASVTPGK